MPNNRVRLFLLEQNNSQIISEGGFERSYPEKLMTLNLRTDSSSGLFQRISITDERHREAVVEYARKLAKDLGLLEVNVAEASYEFLYAQETVIAVWQAM